VLDVTQSLTLTIYYLANIVVELVVPQQPRPRQHQHQRQQQQQLLLVKPQLQLLLEQQQHAQM
jgi:hypothetical protein